MSSGATGEPAVAGGGRPEAPGDVPPILPQPLAPRLLAPRRLLRTCQTLLCCLPVCLSARRWSAWPRWAACTRTSPAASRSATWTALCPAVRACKGRRMLRAAGRDAAPVECAASLWAGQQDWDGCAAVCSCCFPGPAAARRTAYCCRLGLQPAQPPCQIAGSIASAVHSHPAALHPRLQTLGLTPWACATPRARAASSPPSGWPTGGHSLAFGFGFSFPYRLPAGVLMSTAPPAVHPTPPTRSLALPRSRSPRHAAR